MSDPSHNLAALVGARICHDLISPVGAIANGLELIEMEQSARSPEMSLIAESVADANARVQLFRIAFGTTEGAEAIAPAQMRAVFAQLAPSARLLVNWAIDGAVTRAEAQLAILGLMCLESAMPRGGQAVVTRDGTTLALGVTGAVSQHLSRMETLGEDGADITVPPALVHFAMMPGLLRAAGRHAQFTATEGGATLRL